MDVHLRRADLHDVEDLVAIDARADAEHDEGFAAQRDEAERASYRARVGSFADPSRPDAVAWVIERRDGGPTTPVGALMASQSDRQTLAREGWPHLLLDPAVSERVGLAGEPFLEIFQLWVSPEHRRRGLATRLKQALEQEARTRGIGWIYTHTRADNGPVLALNRRLGYREIDRGTLWDDVVRVGLIKRIEQHSG